MSNSFGRYAKWIRNFCFVPPTNDELLCDLSENLQIMRDPYADIGESFRHNINSAITAAAFPYYVAHTSVSRSRFEKILIAEKIRAQNIDADQIGSYANLKEAREQIALKRARQKFSEENSDSDFQKYYVREIYGFLSQELDESIVENAHKEILNQASVLIWAAFEVLCRDLFESYINENPSMLKRIFDDPKASKKFSMPKIDYETLSTYDFDVSSRMGTLLVHKHDFSDIGTIKSALTAVAADEERLKKSLNSDVLWKLYQRRNLFVHRRGVVDQKYLSSTGEAIPLGAYLSQEPAEFEESLREVVRCGADVLFEFSGT
jgi:hypothetical protein